MKLKSYATAVLLISGLSFASAAELDVAQYKVTYDESTDFGWLASWFGGGSNVGFNWTVPSTAAVASSGGLEIVNVPLPAFTVTANSGWALSNLSAFLGNLSFVEVGGATTDIIVHADVSVNGGPAVALAGNMAWAATSSGPGYLLGYFADTYTAPTAFTSFSISNASIDLSATGGVFSSIAAQPQNKLEVSFTAMPVPEPETYAMFLAGLATLGWLSQRRRNPG